MFRLFFKRLRFREYPSFRKQVWKKNQETMGIFLFLFVIIMILDMLGNLALSRSVTFSSSFLLLGYFLLLLILYFVKIRKDIRSATLKFYLMQIPILLVTILMGTVFDRQNQMFTFGVMIIAMPIFILDRPIRVTIYVLCMSALFAAADCHAKSTDLFLLDMRHLTIYSFVSLCLCWFVLADRIDNIMKVSDSMDSAEHDQMTGLYNRGGGDAKIRSFLSQGVAGAFILIDVDNFKHVNDNYGHSTGDEVLKRVSMTLAHAFRQNDVVMRMGGDEFIVYAPGLQDYNFIVTKLNTILREMNKISLDDAGTDLVSVSMGCVVNDGSYPDYEAVFEEADKLLYQVKENGKNDFRLQNIPYDPDRIKRSGQTMRTYDDSPEDEAAKAAMESQKTSS